MNLIRHMYSEITPLKLLPDYPEANESANSCIPSESFCRRMRLQKFVTHDVDKSYFRRYC